MQKTNKQYSSAILHVLNRLAFVSLICLVSCSNCSRSARISKNNDTQESSESVDRTSRESNYNDDDSKNVIPLRKELGVYYITISINGVPMEAIFDTGASTISMSQTEVNFLYKQGKLSDSDFTGTQNFVDANGDVTEGSLINLKNVKIGNKTVHNVTASVVPNFGAPILLGQTALSKLGKITVDYKKNILTFE